MQTEIVDDWAQPRRVADALWMELNRWSKPGRLHRCGRVSWNADGSGNYSVSLTFEYAQGLGLYCWPNFRALSDAQAFVEKWLDAPLERVKAEHGKQWPNVVL